MTKLHSHEILSTQELLTFNHCLCGQEFFFPPSSASSRVRVALLLKKVAFGTKTKNHVGLLGRYARGWTCCYAGEYRNAGLLKTQCFLPSCKSRFRFATKTPLLTLFVIARRPHPPPHQLHLYVATLSSEATLKAAISAR